MLEDELTPTMVCVQGSEDQLKEVWQESDGMDPENFDPKTFFNMHGNQRPHMCVTAPSKNRSLWLDVFVHRSNENNLAKHTVDIIIYACEETIYG